MSDGVRWINKGKPSGIMAGWFTNAIAGAMQILVQEEGDDLFEQRRADERMQRLDSSGPESPRSPSLFADEVEPQLPVAIAEASAPLTGETHTLDHEYDATLQVWA